MNALLSEKKEESAPTKAESDLLRRQLMDKKTQITILEQQAVKFDEFEIGLARLIQDFQNTGKITFVDQSKLEKPFTKPEQVMGILRGGIDALIAKHEKLAARFELEFSRNLFQVNQQVKDIDAELADEQQLAESAEKEQQHAEKVVKFLTREKGVLMRTLRMRKDALDRHAEANVNHKQVAMLQLEHVSKEYEKMSELSQEHDVIAERISASQTVRRNQEKKQLEQHEELIAEREKMQCDLKRESHAHNCTLSKLSRAKEDLKKLMMTIESYHDNLATQELMDSEEENKKLQAVKKNEEFLLKKHSAFVEKREREAKEQITALQERISKLNQQISRTEQQLQTQMLRIPDFQQLKQALDRSIEQCHKYRQDLLERKYMLNDVREKNRRLDEMEIEESMKRMAQLKHITMFDDQDDQESMLPQLIADGQRQRQEMEDLLTHSFL